MEQWVLDKFENWQNSDEYAAKLKIEKEKYAQLDQFLRVFTREKVSSMTKKEYADGAGNKESFCNYVERVFSPFGKTSGRTNAYQKYVIYWDSDCNEYRFGDKRTKQRKGFGSDVDTIFEKVKIRLIEIIDASNNNDYQTIADSPLNPQFKNKVAFLYNRDKEIPIYSENDLNIICRVLNVPINQSRDRAFKREALYNYYKNSELSTIASPYIFMCFIYSWAGLRSYLRDSNNKTIKYDQIALVDIDVAQEKSVNRSTNGTSVRRVYDSSSDDSKRRTGKKGEEIVYEYLSAHKTELGISTITLRCSGENQDDGCGYDMEYTTANGETFFVEVKSTKRNMGDDVYFEMSINEYLFMKNHSDHYSIYFVNDVDNCTVIKRLSGRDLKGEEPSKYTVYFESAIK